MRSIKVPETGAKFQFQAKDGKQQVRKTSSIVQACQQRNPPGTRNVQIKVSFEAEVVRGHCKSKSGAGCGKWKSGAAGSAVFKPLMPVQKERSLRSLAE